MVSPENNSNWLFDYGFLEDITLPDGDLPALEPGFRWPSTALPDSTGLRCATRVKKKACRKKRKGLSVPCAQSAACLAHFVCQKLVVECLLFEPNKPQLNVRISLRKYRSFSLNSVRAFMGRHSYRSFNSWDACHVTEVFEQKFNENSLVEQISTEEFHLGCHSNGALSDGSGLEVQWQEPCHVRLFGICCVFYASEFHFFCCCGCPNKGKLEKVGSRV